MFELIIALYTYIFTDGTLGVKLINIMDNLNFLYWIFLVIFGIVPLFMTLIVSLVGGLSFSEVADSKISKSLSFITGFIGTGSLFGGIFVFMFLSLVLKVILTGYLKSNFSPDITSFSQIQSVDIIPLLGLIALIFISFKRSKIIRREKSKKTIINNNKTINVTVVEDTKRLKQKKEL